MSGTYLYRVRWQAPSWVNWNVRVYQLEAPARRLAERMAANGYRVQVTRAVRGDWEPI